MLFEMAYNWLKDRLFRKKNCEHDWKKIGFVYSEWRGLIGANSFKDTYICKKCDKKEKRAPRDSYNYLYF